MAEKVVIFIDGSNIFRSLRQYFPDVKIDYEMFKDFLAGGRNLINTYYFGSRPVPPKDGQEKFFRKLGTIGISTNIVNLKTYPDGRTKEKGVDMSLAIEALVQGFNHNYDVAVIAAGDEDYLRLIDELKRLGKKVEVASFAKSLSGKIFESGVKIIILDDVIARFTMKEKNG